MPQLHALFQKSGIIGMALLLSMGIMLVSSAASTDIQVHQQVTDEGNGETGGDGGGGFVVPVDATRPRIYDVRIYDITETTARVSFKTDVACLAELYYGRSTKYGSGPLLAHPESYLLEHDFVLRNLTPGAKYYLKLLASNQKGVVGSDTDHSFYTVPEFRAVPNVGSLTARQEERTIVLDWRNPEDEYFRGVQINRSLGGFVSDPTGGEILFSGLAEQFVDANVVDKTEYFYTLFSYDNRGAFSSGVGISIWTNFGGGTPPGPDGDGEPAALKDVVGLTATPDVAGKRIVLEWQCPAGESICLTEVRRDLNFPVSSPREGELICTGTALSCVDSNVQKGQMYYYTVFVRSITGGYSKGKMVASELKEPSTYGGDEMWADTSFVDVESGLVLLPQVGEKITVLEGRSLGISYGLRVLPDHLKEVVARMERASYLLDWDRASQSYQTSFRVPAVGEYPLSLVFVGPDDEPLFEKQITLVVEPLGRVFALEDEPLLAPGLSWSNVFCRLGNLWGGNDCRCQQARNIPDVEIGLFYKNYRGTWEDWNASQFHQRNPLLSDADGKFGFVVPNGEYVLWAEKDGFEGQRLWLQIADNAVNETVEISVKKEARYGILLLIILLILSAIYLKKRHSNRKQKKKKKERKN